MNTLTNEELQVIKARCDAATPGPWEHQNDNHFHVAKDSQIIATMRLLHSPEVNCDNAIFISHARTDIPALLAHIEAMEDKLLQAEVDRKDAVGALECIYEELDSPDECRCEAVLEIARMSLASIESGYCTIQEPQDPKS